VAGDRSALRTVEVRPPAVWSVPAPKAAAPVAAAAPLTVPGPGVLLFAGDRVALVSSTSHEKPKSHVTTEVTHLDLRKGTVAETVVLRSVVEGAKPAGPQVQRTSSALVADLSPSGAVAVGDYADPARVDAWDAAGKWIASLRPADQELTWAGWSADGKLLTLCGGRLTAWELPACKAVYEMPALGVHLALTPDHTLLVVGTANRMDVLDAATGECRGRIDCPAQVLSLAVSADGQHVAALLPAKRGAGMNVQPAAPQEGDFHYLMKGGGWRQVRAWGLADGKPKGEAHVRVPNSLLRWVGPRQVLAGGDYNHGGFLVELDSGCATAYLQAPQDATLGQGSPDDRPWYFVTKPAGPQDPDAFRQRLFAAQAGKLKPEPTGPVKLVAGARPARAGELVFGPRVPLRLEVDIADENRKAEATAAWTACLRDMGQTLGEGGWTLRISGSEADSGSSMQFGPGGALKVQIPLVKGRSELRAPDGTVVAAMDLLQGFLGRDSKYFKKNQGLVQAPNGRSVEEYDFGGRNGKAAMADEIWHNYIVAARFYGMGVVKADGKYVALPMKEVAKLP
jgi:hypothetical protein